MDLHRLRVLHFDDEPTNKEIARTEDCEKTTPRVKKQICPEPAPIEVSTTHVKPKSVRRSRSRKKAIPRIQKSTSDISLSSTNKYKKHSRRTLSLSDISRPFKSNLHSVTQKSDFLGGGSELDGIRKTKKAHRKKRTRRNNIKRDMKILFLCETPKVLKGSRTRSTKYYRRDSSNTVKSSDDIFGFQKNNRLVNQYLYNANCNYLNSLKKFKAAFLRKKQCPELQPRRKHCRLRVLSSAYFGSKESSLKNYNIIHPRGIYNVQQCLKLHSSIRRKSHDASNRRNIYGNLIAADLSRTNQENCHCNSSANMIKPSTKQSISAIALYPIHATQYQNENCPLIHESHSPLRAVASTPRDSLQIPEVSSCICTQYPSKGCIQHSKLSGRYQINQVEKRPCGKKKCLKNHFVRLYSGVLEKLTLHSKSNISAKDLFKYALLGLFVIVWCPCVFALTLAWIITYPLKLHHVMAVDTSNKRFLFSKLSKNHRGNEHHHICSECCSHKNHKGFWSWLGSWPSRAAVNVVNSIRTLKSIFKITEKQQCSNTSVCTQHPDPNKKYSLYYAGNRGWVMKPFDNQSSKAYNRNQILQHGREDGRFSALRKRIQRKKACGGQHDKPICSWPTNKHTQTCRGVNRLTSQSTQSYQVNPLLKLHPQSSVSRNDVLIEIHGSDKSQISTHKLNESHKITNDLLVNFDNNSSQELEKGQLPLNFLQQLKHDKPIIDNNVMESSRKMDKVQNSLCPVPRAPYRKPKMQCNNNYKKSCPMLKHVQNIKKCPKPTQHPPSLYAAQLRRLATCNIAYNGTLPQYLLGPNLYCYHNKIQPCLHKSVHKKMLKCLHVEQNMQSNAVLVSSCNNIPEDKTLTKITQPLLKQQFSQHSLGRTESDTYHIYLNKLNSMVDQLSKYLDQSKTLAHHINLNNIKHSSQSRKNSANKNRFSRKIQAELTNLDNYSSEKHIIPSHTKPTSKTQLSDTIPELVSLQKSVNHNKKSNSTPKQYPKLIRQKIQVNRFQIPKADAEKCPCSFITSRPLSSNSLTTFLEDDHGLYVSPHKKTHSLQSSKEKYSAKQLGRYLRKSVKQLYSKKNNFTSSTGNSTSDLNEENNVKYCERKVKRLCDRKQASNSHHRDYTNLKSPQPELIEKYPIERNRQMGKCLDSNLQYQPHKTSTKYVKENSVIKKRDQAENSGTVYECRHTRSHDQPHKITAENINRNETKKDSIKKAQYIQKTRNEKIVKDYECLNKKTQYSSHKVPGKNDERNGMVDKDSIQKSHLLSERPPVANRQKKRSGVVCECSESKFQYHPDKIPAEIVNQYVTEESTEESQLWPQHLEKTRSKNSGKICACSNKKSQYPPHKVPGKNYERNAMVREDSIKKSRLLQKKTKGSGIICECPDTKSQYQPHKIPVENVNRILKEDAIKVSKSRTQRIEKKQSKQPGTVRECTNKMLQCLSRKVSGKNVERNRKYSTEKSEILQQDSAIVKKPIIQSGIVCECSDKKSQYRPHKTPSTNVNPDGNATKESNTGTSTINPKQEIYKTCKCPPANSQSEPHNIEPIPRDSHALVDKNNGLADKSRSVHNQKSVIKKQTKHNGLVCECPTPVTDYRNEHLHSKLTSESFEKLDTPELSSLKRNTNKMPPHSHKQPIKTKYKRSVDKLYQKLLRYFSSDTECSCPSGINISDKLSDRTLKQPLLEKNIRTPSNTKKSLRHMQPPNPPDSGKVKCTCSVKKRNNLHSKDYSNSSKSRTGSSQRVRFKTSEKAQSSPVSRHVEPLTVDECSCPKDKTQRLSDRESYIPLKKQTAKTKLTSNSTTKEKISHSLRNAIEKLQYILSRYTSNEVVCICSKEELDTPDLSLNTKTLQQSTSHPTVSPAQRRLPKDRATETTHPPAQTSSKQRTRNGSGRPLPLRYRSPSENLALRRPELPSVNRINPPTGNICDPTCLSKRPQPWAPGSRMPMDYPTIIPDPLCRRYAVHKRNIQGSSRERLAFEKRVKSTKEPTKGSSSKNKRTFRERCSELWEKFVDAVIYVDANMWPDDFNCDGGVYLHTLKNKPCLCLFRCCPSMYPCLFTVCSLVKNAWKTFLYILAAICWCPFLIFWWCCCINLCNCFRH